MVSIERQIKPNKRNFQCTLYFRYIQRCYQMLVRGSYRCFDTSWPIRRSHETIYSRHDQDRRS